jgi:DNA-binding MarR family transcriptional regulator
VTLGVDEQVREWTIFSTHGLVLLHLAAHPERTLRQVSADLGITERHTARVIKDLEGAGMITIERQGRRNTYTINPQARLRHPRLADIDLTVLLDAVKRSLEDQ